MSESFYVKAVWDAEPGVWISESDIPGLVIEADTLAEFEELMDALAPEMLADNLGIRARSVAVRFWAERRTEMKVA